MANYAYAKEVYAKFGVDTDKAIETLKNVPVAVHCWQGDDVVGFDSKEALSGGIQTTGNYPGKATTPAELIADFDKAISLVPGAKNGYLNDLTEKATGKKVVALPIEATAIGNMMIQIKRSK